jgi:DNA-binding LacI/PurR family transcriptional regulator
MTASEAAPPGDCAAVPRRATVKMVAEAAGVSTATVSYVLSGRSGGRAGVSPQTESRVRRAARELRYRPNRSARAMRTGRTGVALLSLHMMSDPWSLAVSAAVANAARADAAADVVPLVLADGDWFDALQRQDCDVAYLDGVRDDAEDRRRLGELVAQGRRLVVFSETLEPDGFDVVRSPAVPGCRLAVEHLLARHDDVACLAAAAAVAAAGPSRWSAYTDALAARGRAVRPDRVATYEDSQASAFAGALRLLDRPDPPRAVYATTDFAAIAAIGAAHRLGLRVPGDVAVAGVGNTPDGEVSAPGLTTVGPQDFFGAQARILLDVARHGVTGRGRMHEFAWSLVVRESSGGPRRPARESRAGGQKTEQTDEHTDERTNEETEH